MTEDPKASLLRQPRLRRSDLLSKLDGTVGMGPGDANVPGRGPQEWASYRARVEAAEREAARRWPTAGTDGAAR